MVRRRNQGFFACDGRSAFSGPALSAQNDIGVEFSFHPTPPSRQLSFLTPSSCPPASQSRYGKPTTRPRVWPNSPRVPTNAAKDNPLRRDVRSLGAILGQVLVEQSGQELFESVEELRRLLIEHRETVRRKPGAGLAPNSCSRCRKSSRSMDLSRAYQVTKAFATYFELTNLAETNHRKRRRRAGKLDREQPPLPGSFRGTLSAHERRRNFRPKMPSQLCARSRSLRYSPRIPPKSRARPSC